MHRICPASYTGPGGLRGQLHARDVEQGFKETEIPFIYHAAQHGSGGAIYGRHGEAVAKTAEAGRLKPCTCSELYCAAPGGYFSPGVPGLQNGIRACRALRRGSARFHLLSNCSCTSRC